VSDHLGRRRRQARLPLGRLFLLIAALLPVAYALTLAEPSRPESDPGHIAPRPTPATWAGPAPVKTPARLPDGSSYAPRVFISGTESVGTAETADHTFLRVLAVTAGRVAELRRVPAADLPQFDGFAVSGDTVVWAESVSRASATVRTTLWRASWKAGSRGTQIPAATGEAVFSGSPFDLVVQAGRVSWVATAGTATEVRSVALTGGTVTTKRLEGDFRLTAPPWAVSGGTGRGVPVQLIDLTTNRKVTVPTNAAEIAECGPTLCRMGVINNNTLARIDLQRPDGTERRRIAGSEATPVTTEVALLGRFVALKTDIGPGGGLSLYDIRSGRTDLVAVDVANVQGRDALLWWSTGAGDDLVWNALDLRVLG
jgi:hypothetical protein